MIVASGVAMVTVGASAFLRLGFKGNVRGDNAQLELEHGLFSVFMAGKAGASRMEAGMIFERVKSASLLLMVPDLTSRRQAAARNAYRTIDLGPAGMVHWWTPDPARATALRYAHGAGLTVPAWPAPVVAGVVGWLLIWWDKRVLRGRCTKCGYDLAGLAAGVACPECGRGASVLVRPEGG